MKNNSIFVLCLIMTVAFSVVCQSSGEGVGTFAQYSIEEFLSTTSYTGASFSPDNSKILVSSNESGIYNAYSIAVSGGDRTKITNSSDESIFAIGYFPGDERILYTSDKGGNELNHIYVRELDGSIRDLTPGKGLKAQFLGWSKDDRSIFVGSNKRDNRFFDIYEITLEDYTSSLLFQDDTGYQFADISPDRRYILMTKINSNADSDVYLFDRNSGETKNVSVHKGAVLNLAQEFSPGGTSLYYLTDEESEFQYLVKHTINTGSKEVVEKVNWDVLYSSFSRQGKYFVVGINNDARTELKVYDAADMSKIDLPEIQDAEVTSVSFSKDERLMSFYASSSSMPGDLFVYDFGGGSPRQLTTSLNPAIEPGDLVYGEVVRFDSYDGVEIPGILYKPHQASGDNKVPALVWVHGGPGGQSRVGYAAIIQYIVNHGYAVFAINNRGSSGYGKTFFHLDDQKHGENDLDDCVASKKMLAETGFIDPERIGIMGGSYGGYMVLAALAFRPEEFKVGVDLFGISNWYRTLQSIPPWWESQRVMLEQEMGPFDDEAFFRKKSPLFHADNIVKPMMVLQGANDPRVLKVESDEIVEAVRNKGVPVEYIVFDDEGHGFMKRKNQERGYEAILRFLDLYLKGSR